MFYFTFPKSRVEDKGKDANGLSQEAGVKETESESERLLMEAWLAWFHNELCWKLQNASKSCPLENWEMGLFTHPLPLFKVCFLGTWRLPDSSSVFSHRPQGFQLCLRKMRGEVGGGVQMQRDICLLGDWLSGESVSKGKCPLQPHWDRRARVAEMWKRPEASTPTGI